MTKRALTAFWIGCLGLLLAGFASAHLTRPEAAPATLSAALTSSSAAQANQPAPSTAQHSPSAAARVQADYAALTAPPAQPAACVPDGGECGGPGQKCCGYCCSGECKKHSNCKN